jgi:catechol 2,3-dioxygenase-like lactoylglutathione lyase family enzyme
MDNVGIVVDDLGRTIDFFRELGLELEGRATIEGKWAGRVTGLGDQRVESIKTGEAHCDAGPRRLAPLESVGAPAYRLVADSAFPDP